MTLHLLTYFLKVLFPDTVTLEVRVSTYKRGVGAGGHNSVHSRSEVIWKEQCKSINPNRMESMESTGLELEKQEVIWQHLRWRGAHIRATAFKWFIHLFKRHLSSTAHIKPYAIIGAKRNRDAASTVSITEAMVLSPRGSSLGLNWLQFCLAVDKLYSSL